MACQQHGAISRLSSYTPDRIILLIVAVLQQLFAPIPLNMASGARKVGLDRTGFA